METSQPLWQHLSMFDHLHSEKCHLVFRQNFYFFNFYFVPIASCPVTGDDGEEAGFLNFIPSHQEFIHIDEIPWAFSSPGWTVPVPSASYERCSSPLNAFMALCWTHTSMSMPLLYWGAQNWTQCSTCVSSVLSREEGSPRLMVWWPSS